MSRGVLAAALVAWLAAAPATGGIRTRPGPSEFHDAPLLALFEGLDPRPVPQWPANEPLAAYRAYRVRDVTGLRIGDLRPYGRTRLPVWQVQSQDGKPRGTLTYDRERPGQGFLLRNAGQFPLMRFFPLRTVFGEYEIRDTEGTAVATLFPRPGSRLWEFRGDAAARSLLQRLGMPIPAATFRVQEAFRDLHGGGR